MRLLQYGDAHHKNTESMKRMCNKFNIEYYYSDNLNSDYDIIWSPAKWINPNLFPSSKFIFGPQFWVLPDTNHPFFSDSKPEHASRSVFICLSNWIEKLYNEITDISKSNIPFLPLPLGVDIQDCNKNKDEIEYDCILYFKNRHVSLLNFVEGVLKSYNYKYKVYTYGSYNNNDYMETLKRSKFVIWLGRHESQGFAFQECLATNTPIYVYDVKSMKEECSSDGRFYYTEYSQKLLATAASWWDSRCGLKVYSNEEFIDCLPKFINNLDTFKPLEFVKENLSDEVCFKRFMDALKIC